MVCFPNMQELLELNPTHFKVESIILMLTLKTHQPPVGTRQSRSGKAALAGRRTRTSSQQACDRPRGQWAVGTHLHTCPSRRPLGVPHARNTGRPSGKNPFVTSPGPTFLSQTGTWRVGGNVYLFFFSQPFLLFLFPLLLQLGPVGHEIRFQPTRVRCTKPVLPSADPRVR